MKLSTSVPFVFGLIVFAGIAVWSGEVGRAQQPAPGKSAARESMLHEIQQRIRDVRQNPDGFLCLLTAENDGALIGIEPTPGRPAPSK